MTSALIPVRERCRDGCCADDGEGAFHVAWRAADGATLGADSDVRWELTCRYAWAVPSRQALDVIGSVAAGRLVVEVGAGTGYWAHLLRRDGLEVVAVDEHPPGVHDNGFGQPVGTWSQVDVGGPEVAASCGDSVLLLVYPPAGEPMAAESLAWHAGRTVVYVGEPSGGRSGDRRFFDMLARRYVVRGRFALPRWADTLDELVVYEKASR